MADHRRPPHAPLSGELMPFTCPYSAVPHTPNSSLITTSIPTFPSSSSTSSSFISASSSSSTVAAVAHLTSPHSLFPNCSTSRSSGRLPSPPYPFPSPTSGQVPKMLSSSVPSMQDLMVQFEASTTLRDTTEEPRPAWRATWADQDNAFQTEFDSELSFLCDRIHVREEDPMASNMPYIL